jgi:hypothetical protein
VAQVEATLAARTLELQVENDETSDGSERCDPEIRKIIAGVQTYDTTSVQFANRKTKEVYVCYLSYKVIS